MDKLKKYWKNIPSPVRKPLIGIVGTFIVIVGIILLPLPGPGWVIIFLGFAILATEFVFAEKVRDWLVNQLQTAMAKAKVAWAKFRRKVK